MLTHLCLWQIRMRSNSSEVENLPQSHPKCPHVWLCCISTLKKWKLNFEKWKSGAGWTQVPTRLPNLVSVYVLSFLAYSIWFKLMKHVFSFELIKHLHYWLPGHPSERHQATIDLNIVSPEINCLSNVFFLKVTCRRDCLCQSHIFWCGKPSPPNNSWKHSHWKWNSFSRKFNEKKE